MQAFDPATVAQHQWGAALASQERCFSSCSSVYRDCAGRASASHTGLNLSSDAIDQAGLDRSVVRWFRLFHRLAHEPSIGGDAAFQGPTERFEDMFSGNDLPYAIKGGCFDALRCWPLSPGAGH